MKNWSVLSAVMIVIIISISLFFIFNDQNPEYKSVISDDGFVEVSGDMREGILQNIDIQAEVGSRFLPWEVYYLGSEEVTVEAPLDLTFHLDERVIPRADELLVYRYNPELMMWEQFHPTVEHTDSRLHVEVNQLGYYTLGYGFELDDLSQSLPQDLLDLAPENTIGFEAALGMAPEGEAMVRVPGQVNQIGGCSGVFRSSETTERSMQSNITPIMIDNLVTNVDLSWVAIWYTDEQGGCNPSDLSASKPI